MRKEREREAWELQNYPAGEIAEMVELFVARGMSREDAEFVIQRMAKYKDFFVDLMMTEELALPVPGEDDNNDALKDGLVMFLAFTAFGMLPIVGFVAAGAFFPGLESDQLFSVACIITGINLSASAPSRRDSTTSSTSDRAWRRSSSAASARRSPSLSAAPSLSTRVSTSFLRSRRSWRRRCCSR